MAEKTIGLRLQINGVSQTISNINQLEQSISQLEGELKNVDIGSEKFNQLSNEIRTARGRLEDFNKSTEGFGFEKLVESVGKFSAGVTGAFATAGAAAQLFGADTEGVSKAAERAQNLLTLAVGATTIAEGLLAAKKLFLNNLTIKQTATTVVATGAVEAQAVATGQLAVAETGAAAATGVLTTALNTLGNAIRKNPILFIAGALLAAGAAIYTFTQEVDESADAVAKLDNETSKLIQTQEQLVNSQENALQKELALAEARGASIEEIAQLRQKGIQNEINDAQKRLTIIENAQKKEIAIQLRELNKGTIDREEYNKRKLEIDKKYGDQSFQQKTAQAAAETKLEIDKIQTQREITDRNNERAKVVRDLQTQLIKNDLVKQLTDLENKYIDDLKLNKDNFAAQKKLEEIYIKERAEILANAEKENLELQIKIFKEARELDLSNSQIKLRDLEIFNNEQLRLFVENSVRLNEANKEREAKDESVTIFGQTKKYNLTAKQYNAVLELQRKYERQQDALRKEGQLESLKSLEDAQNKEFLIRLKNGDDIKGSQEELLKTQTDIFNREFEAFKESELKKIKFLAEQEAIQKGLSTEETIGPKGAEMSAFTKYVENRIEGYKKLFDAIKVTSEKEIELNNKKLVQQTQIDKLTQQSTLMRLDAEKEYYDEIIKQQEVFVTNDKMTKKQLEDNEREYKRKVRDEELKYAQESLLIQKKLIEDKLKLLEKDPTMNAEALKQLYAELAKINVDYNNNVRQQNANTATDTEDAFQETIGKIQKVVDTFSQTIGQIGSLLSQSYSLQLEQLQLDYENTMSQIVGETNEANILREKEEIMYQNKKKAIEKKARIDSLNIQLAQAVADSASAVLKTLAQYGATPVGIALSILAGGLGLVQIGLITQQKNMVQSMARGGFLRGPSHEQGGVKFQNGGVELEGNEAVINRRSTLAYAPLLSQINEQGGGKPIYVNSIMDSRMAEVLASTRNEPIRAYVLEQDITKSQAVNRRLEELASF